MNSLKAPWSYDHIYHEGYISKIKQGDSYSEVIICFGIKFKLSVDPWSYDHIYHEGYISKIKQGDSYSEVIICFGIKFKLSVDPVQLLKVRIES